MPMTTAASTTAATIAPIRIGRLDFGPVVLADELAALAEASPLAGAAACAVDGKGREETDFWEDTVLGEELFFSELGDCGDGLRCAASPWIGLCNGESLFPAPPERFRGDSARAIA